MVVSTPLQAKERLTFGVVPQQSATKLARLWGPFLKQLGELSGYEIRFRTATDIPTFEQRVSLGEYDLAYMNPYHYTVFHRSPGYMAFAKERDKQIQGIVIVHKDSPITQISDLDKQVVAFPSPGAFAASILPRAEFARSGIDVTPTYVTSHDSVYRAVAAGLKPAGGGVLRTLNR
ncbi:hypothetical protein BOW53_16320 [Solemya pervernicosa gill symbiont]|uniref:Phosphate ABC transporter substrate-binding protein n=2 Tax=Solemya pervernicosa gill symbiont TaxID=642797 RepID=A0A1T2KZC8_9GAMM|nr:hypothetical protein BOW53_16320 [Solemya pervernicosa gill symbiont]